MTAKQLIEKLQDLVDREDAGDLPVVIAGCDCYDDACDVDLQARNPAGGAGPCVVIERP